jgi:tetratricopeptide (TPR) repeat protein
VRTRLISALDPDAEKLAKELDGLPLALATAGAYLAQTAISYLDYLRLYKASWANLQKTTPELSSYEDRTLYSTWQISFEHVKRWNELAAKLLCLWAYFDNQDIWFELLRHGDSEDPEWVHELTKNELNFHAAARVLSNHGLVEVDGSSRELIESSGYSIHGCVHSWTINVLNQEWDYDLARLALKLIGLHIPGKETDKWWVTQRRLLQHVTRCSDLMSNDLVAIEGMEWACHELGRLYADQGKLDEAEKMYERALQGNEKTLGAEHTSTLDTVNNLAVLYSDQGKLDEAEKMYERALQGSEKALGAQNIATYIPALNANWGLGSLFQRRGDLAKAKIIYSKALVGYEKVYGRDHPRCQTLREILGALDTEPETNVLIKMGKDPGHEPDRQASHCIVEDGPSKSKRLGY